MLVWLRNERLFASQIIYTRESGRGHFITILNVSEETLTLYNPPFVAHALQTLVTKHYVINSYSPRNLAVFQLQIMLLPLLSTNRAKIQFLGGADLLGLPSNRRLWPPWWGALGSELL